MVFERRMGKRLNRNSDVIKTGKVVVKNIVVVWSISSLFNNNLTSLLHVHATFLYIYFFCLVP